MTCARTLPDDQPCRGESEPRFGIPLCEGCWHALRQKIYGGPQEIFRDFVASQVGATYWGEGATYCVLLPNGRFKIGCVRQVERLADRWKSLSRHLGDRVVPLCTERGGPWLEFYRHAQFAASRAPLRGEQFEPTPEMRAYATRGHIPEGIEALEKFNRWQPRTGTLHTTEE